MTAVTTDGVVTFCVKDVTSVVADVVTTDGVVTFCVKDVTSKFEADVKIDGIVTPFKILDILI